MESYLLRQLENSRNLLLQQIPPIINKICVSTLITSFPEPGIADSSLNNSARLKIHQNAVFHILTRTWIH